MRGMTGMSLDSYYLESNPSTTEVTVPPCKPNIPVSFQGLSLLGILRAALYLETHKYPQPSLLMKIIYHSNSITGQDVLHV